MTAADQLDAVILPQKEYRGYVDTHVTSWW